MSTIIRAKVCQQANCIHPGAHVDLPTYAFQGPYRDAAGAPIVGPIVGLDVFVDVRVPDDFLLPTGELDPDVFGKRYDAFWARLGKAKTPADVIPA